MGQPKPQLIWEQTYQCFARLLNIFAIYGDLAENGESIFWSYLIVLLVYPQQTKHKIPV